MPAEFETLQSETRDFGTAGFVSVERKRVTDSGKAPSEFLLIARGFYLKDGRAHRKNFVTLPNDPDVREFVARAVRELSPASPA